MRGKWLLLFAVFLCLVPQSAGAARFSGNYLIEMCSSNDKGEPLVPGGHVACQSYIAGVLDYHNLVRSLGTAPSVDFCIPESVDMNALQKQVLSYLLRNRNEHGNFIAAPGVALALYEKFPCK